MGEERGYSRSGGKSFSGRGKFGGHRSGAKSGSAERHGGFHKDGFHKGGFHKDGLRRDGFHKGSFKRDGERNERNERRDFDSNDTRRDGDRKSFNKSGFKRDGFKRDGFHKGSFKRDGERNDRRFNHRFDSNDESRFERSDAYRSQNSGSVKSGNPRYKKSDNNRFNRFNGNDERYDNRKSSRDGFNNGDFRKDGVKRNGFHKDGFHKDGFKNHGERRLENRDSNRTSHSENRYNRYDKRVEDRNFNYENGPRRNSDGTISYPSQNPYTARRPGEPKMPKGMEWAMLSKESRERLRGLSKEHAENIGLHILAAYALEEEEPKLALEHAKWAAKQASRIDFSRETLAFIAYRQGDYKLAAREFRTAMRMNGYLDYLPFIADCERGIGNLDKALEICMSDEAKSVVGEVKAELFLVYAGVLADTNHIDKAIELVHVMGRSKGLPGEYRMRAIQAEQYFLEEAGRSDEALELEGLLDRLEEQYADIEDHEVNPEDIVIDYDLEHFNESLLEDIGVSKDDAKFAPEDSEDSYDSYDSEDSEDSEDSDDSESLDDSSFEESKSDSLAESANPEKDNNKLSSSDNVETTSNGTVDSKE